MTVILLTSLHPELTALLGGEASALMHQLVEKEPGLHIPGLLGFSSSLLCFAVSFPSFAPVQEEGICPEQPWLLCEPVCCWSQVLANHLAILPSLASPVSEVIL